MEPSLSASVRPTQARVDLGAIAHNYRQIKAVVGPKVGVLAVIKADAYGHGAVPVARCLEAQGVAMLGVAIAEEALELRDAGLALPIIVLGQILPPQARDLVERDIRITVSDYALAQAVNSAARRAGVQARLHVKIDTGMGRLGVLEAQAVDTVADIATLDRIEIEGLATHLSSASERDQSFTHLQLDTFRAIVSQLRERGVWIPLAHAANSAGTLLAPAGHFDLVRPGLALYGLLPGPAVQCPLDLRPALSLRTRVVLVKDLPAGRPVSYGRTFHTTRPTRTAVLTLGYNDGYLRCLSGRSWVRVRGRLCPVIGTICMDQCVVDVTNVPGVAVGDEAVVYEANRRSPLCIERIAEKAGTVPHEVLCLIGRRVPRVYVDATGTVDVEACTAASDTASDRRRAAG